MATTVASRKAKGRRFQQWVAKKVSLMTNIPWGKDELIRSREMGQSGVDVVLIGEAKRLFPFAIECKNQEKFSLPAWIKQAKSNQDDSVKWLLFCKRNNESPVVVLDADDFFHMFEKLLEATEGDW